MLDRFISVVCVMEDDNNIFSERIVNLQKHLHKNFTDYELVIVDQCSNDESVHRLNDMMKKIPSIRHLRLSQKVKSDVALAAGTESAIGDFIVIMSLIRDPVDCVLDLVKKCMDGFDIVVGVCPKAYSKSSAMITPLIEGVFSKIGYQLPRYATDLRCLSRRVVNSVTETGRYHHKFFVRISKTGFPNAKYTYSVNDEFDGNSKSLYRLTREAFRTLIFNSTSPLRWMSGLGIFGSFLAFIFSAYSLLANIFSGNVAQGWTTLVLFTSTLFMLLFIILAFFGEYLGRLLDDRSEQRDYFILYEGNSSVMLNEDRVNVLDESCD